MIKMKLVLIFFKNIRTIFTSRVTLYLGKLGLIVKTPFINLRTRGWDPTLTQFSNCKNDDNALLAVLIQLYPKPALYNSVKYVKTLSTFASKILIFLLLQNDTHFSIYVRYCFLVDSLHDDNKMAWVSFDRPRLSKDFPTHGRFPALFSSADGSYEARLEELVNSVCLVICNFFRKPSVVAAGTNVVSARLVQLQWLPSRPRKSFEAPILSDWKDKICNTLYFSTVCSKRQFSLRLYREYRTHTVWIENCA